MIRHGLRTAPLGRIRGPDEPEELEVAQAVRKEQEARDAEHPEQRLAARALQPLPPPLETRPQARAEQVVGA